MTTTTYYSYITLNRVRYYVMSNETSNTPLTITCSIKERNGAIIKARGAGYFLAIESLAKYQTEENYTKMLADKESKRITAESVKAVKLLPRVRALLLTKKDDTKKARNKAIFASLRSIDIKGDTKRAKFLNIISAVETLGHTVDPIIVEYVTTLK